MAVKNPKQIASEQRVLHRKLQNAVAAVNVSDASSAWREIVQSGETIPSSVLNAYLFLLAAVGENALGTSLSAVALDVRCPANVTPHPPFLLKNPITEGTFVNALRCSSALQSPDGDAFALQVFNIMTQRVRTLRRRSYTALLAAESPLVVECTIRRAVAAMVPLAPDDIWQVLRAGLGATGAAGVSAGCISALVQSNLVRVSDVLHVIAAGPSLLMATGTITTRPEGYKDEQPVAPLLPTNPDDAAAGAAGADDGSAGEYVITLVPDGHTPACGPQPCYPSAGGFARAGVRNFLFNRRGPRRAPGSGEWLAGAAGAPGVPAVQPAVQPVLPSWPFASAESSPTPQLPPPTTAAVAATAGSVSRATAAAVAANMSGTCGGGGPVIPAGFDQNILFASAAALVDLVYLQLPHADPRVALLRAAGADVIPAHDAALVPLAQVLELCSVDCFTLPSADAGPHPDMETPPAVVSAALGACIAAVTQGRDAPRLTVQCATGSAAPDEPAAIPDAGAGARVRARVLAFGVRLLTETVAGAVDSTRGALLLRLAARALRMASVDVATALITDTAASTSTAPTAVQWRPRGVACTGCRTSLDGNFVRASECLRLAVGVLRSHIVQHGATALAQCRALARRVARDRPRCVIDGANVGFYGVTSWGKCVVVTHDGRLDRAATAVRQPVSDAAASSAAESTATKKRPTYDADDHTGPATSETCEGAAQKRRRVAVVPLRMPVVEAVRTAMASLGVRPLVVLHCRHVDGAVARIAEGAAVPQGAEGDAIRSAQPLPLRWAEAGELYVCPRGVPVPDDVFWMLAALVSSAVGVYDAAVAAGIARPVDPPSPGQSPATSARDHDDTNSTVTPAPAPAAEVLQLLAAVFGPESLTPAATAALNSTAAATPAATPPVQMSHPDWAAVVSAADAPATTVYVVTNDNMRDHNEALVGTADYEFQPREGPAARGGRGRGGRGTAGGVSSSTPPPRALGDAAGGEFLLRGSGGPSFEACSLARAAAHWRAAGRVTFVVSDRGEGPVTARETAALAQLLNGKAMAAAPPPEQDTHGGELRVQFVRAKCDSDGSERARLRAESTTGMAVTCSLPTHFAVAPQGRPHPPSVSHFVDTATSHDEDGDGSAPRVADAIGPITPSIAADLVEGLVASRLHVPFVAHPLPDVLISADAPTSPTCTGPSSNGDHAARPAEYVDPLSRVRWQCISATDTL